jgi:hypothetical protein
VPPLDGAVNPLPPEKPVSATGAPLFCTVCCGARLPRDIAVVNTTVPEPGGLPVTSP